MVRRKHGIDEEIDGLFAVDPSGFIAARDELAKRLKAEDRAEEAAEVRGLRRPTVAAWAANQVARQQPEEVRELLEAGADLRQAQRKVLSGVKGGGFREAMDRRRKAVAALVKLAEEVLRESGKGSAGTIDALQPTFEAASVDQDAGERLAAGRLERELPAPSGFGGVTGLEVVVAPPEKPRPRRTRKEKEEEAEARAGQEAVRREARELEKRSADARRAAIRARAVASRAEERAEQLTREAAEAKAAARRAGADAKQAEAEAKRAETAADRAAARIRS